MIHDGVKNHKCEYCAKAFTLASTLRKHVRLVHEGVKAHQCIFCGKMFKEARNLKEHINNIHEGLKHPKEEGAKGAVQRTNVQCEFCGKHFSLEVNLKRHVNCVHLGIKKFKCEYCGKQFGLKQDVTKHIGKYQALKSFSKPLGRRAKRADRQLCFQDSGLQDSGLFYSERAAQFGIVSRASF